MKLTFKKNNGMSFQDELDKICLQYSMQGIATLKRTGLMVKFAKPIVFIENPFLDYVGAWTERGGVMISMEAKSTSKPRLPIAKSSNLKEQQITNMYMWEKAAAVSILLWRYDGKTKWLRVSEIRHQMRNGVRHLKWENARGPIPQGMGFITVDFMKIIREEFI